MNYDIVTYREQNPLFKKNDLDETLKNLIEKEEDGDVAFAWLLNIFNWKNHPNIFLQLTEEEDGNTLRISFEETQTIKSNAFMTALINLIENSAEHNIKKIDFDHCQFDEDVWKTFIYKISSSDIKIRLIFIKCYLSNAHLQHLNFYKNEMIKRIFSIQIDGQDMDEEFTKSLSLFFDQNNYIKNVKLQGNDLKDHAIRVLAESLKTCKSLDTLSLENNLISDFVVAKLADILKSTPLHELNLEVIL